MCDRNSDVEAILNAVAQFDSWVTHFASQDLRKWGIEKYIAMRFNERRAFDMFLFGGRFQLITPLNPESCILQMLNRHGIHFAIRFKKLIADFAGVKRGSSLLILTDAAIKLLCVNKTRSKLLQSNIEK